MTNPTPEEPTRAQRLGGWLRKRGPWLLLELVVILGIFYAITLYKSRDLIESGTAAPEFTLPDLDGQRRSLSEFRGKPTLLVFWATWCSVCEAEQGNIADIHRERDDVNVVSVALGYESRDEVIAYAREHDIPYPVLLGDTRIAEHFKVSSFPTHYMLDPDGTISSSTVGYTTELGLELRLD